MPEITLNGPWMGCQSGITGNAITLLSAATHVAFMSRGAAGNHWHPLKILRSFCNMRDMEKCRMRSGYFQILL